MNYLIVDDEPYAHEVIESMCTDLPFMTLKGNCFEALEALDFLAKETVDLMFLDIHMPKLDGFEFLRTLKQPPHIIVISADRQYALEGYDLDISDYLLKPFVFERFLRAVNKVRASMSEQERNEAKHHGEIFFFKDGKKHHQVLLNDIAYIEARGNYCLIHLSESWILTQEKITDLAVRLPEMFLRVHKSYIVACRKIQLIESNQLRIGEKAIPVGRFYKPALTKFLKTQY